MTERAPRLRWWREVVYVIAFYGVYTFIRNTGAATGSKDRAFANARHIVHLERTLHLFIEHGVQNAFVGWTWFIRFWNIYYGSFHFIVTAAAIVWCFRKMPARYPLWRNTLAITTGLALIGYAFYPLMPPRLLPGSGFVDTLASIGGLWSFDSGTMKAVSNQYAAMPSLHFGWAMWCAMVFWPAARGRIQWQALIIAYPIATLFAIVVTANHYWMDAAGGALALATGYAVSSVLTPMLASRARSSDSNVATVSS